MNRGFRSGREQQARARTAQRLSTVLGVTPARALRNLSLFPIGTEGYRRYAAQAYPEVPLRQMQSQLTRSPMFPPIGEGVGEFSPVMPLWGVPDRETLGPSDESRRLFWELLFGRR